MSAFDDARPPRLAVGRALTATCEQQSHQNRRDLHWHAGHSLMAPGRP
jgi:hypothetical protein